MAAEGSGLAGGGTALLVESFPAELEAHLIGLRRDLHRRPELSLTEHATAARLEQELARLEPAKLERVAGTGVVARIRGRDSSRPWVALRGDIDALPIEEATGLPFASEVPGVMHACGHDVHAAWAVGAATLLASRPAAGDVVILLQPAEELAQGALALMAAGALDRVAVIFGAHVDRRFEVGRVVASAGPMAASSDAFEIELLGAGGHGARPQEARDPIVGAAAVIQALQTILSRRLAPGRAGVITIGKIAAGTASNVIPDRANLWGTLRATCQEDRDFLCDELVQVATACAASYGLEAQIRFLDRTPPLVNSAQPADWAQAAVERVLGRQALAELSGPNMAGEDFAFYLERVPGCFLRIGVREPGGSFISTHSPHFRVDEGALAVGAAVLAEAARVASEAL